MTQNQLTIEYDSLTERHELYAKYGNLQRGCAACSRPSSARSSWRSGALDEGWHVVPDPDAAGDLVATIDRALSDACLRRSGDTSTWTPTSITCCGRVSTLRNRLAHGFFAKHNYRIQTEEGRAAMVEDLGTLHADVFVAWQATSAISTTLTELIGRVRAGPKLQAHRGSRRCSRTRSTGDGAAPRSRWAYGSGGRAASPSPPARRTRPGACGSFAAARSRHLEHRKHGAEGARLLPRHQPLRVVRPRRVAEHVHPELLAAVDAAHQPKPSPELGHRHPEEAREAAHHRDCRPAVRLGRAACRQRGVDAPPGSVRRSWPGSSPAARSSVRSIARSSRRQRIASSASQPSRPRARPSPAR